jgi:ABC-type sugar transport system ATPase subunit
VERTIQIHGLAKRFPDGTQALQAVDLEVADGELVVLVGPSGSGKTTLLRLVAGLDEPTAGTIQLDGKDVAGVPPHRRNVALVFQNFALYSHLTVEENLTFGQERRSKAQIGEAASLLGISHLLNRYPADLSGGEQQRVALGRAIVRQPAAWLLDEPLSSLDGPVRRTLRRELKRLQRQLGVPTVYVTHDQAEALALGDRIAVLAEGIVQQAGSPSDVYDRPANRFVANFFGLQGMNFVERPGNLWKTGRTDATCGFRPEDVTIADDGQDLRGIVESYEQLGDATYVQIRIGCERIATRLARHATPPKSNEEIPIRIDPTKLHWFDSKTGTRLTPDS